MPNPIPQLLLDELRNAMLAELRLPTGITIEHCRKRHCRDWVGRDRRQAAMSFLEQHYTGTGKVQGHLFAVVKHVDTPTEQILGACVIGGTSSQAFNDTLASREVDIRACRRLYADDRCPIPESQLFRYACRYVAAAIGHAFLIVSLADPAARSNDDAHLPLTGAVYLSAGLFYAGTTVGGSRPVLINRHTGQHRSTRQGPITLNKQDLTPDWAWVEGPPAFVWLAPIAPNRVPAPDGRRWRSTSERERHRQKKAIWQALVLNRRVIATQWIEQRGWQRLNRQWQLPLLGISDERPPNLRVTSEWPGQLLNRFAAPIRPPIMMQLGFDEVLLDDERTAGRVYRPDLALVLQASVASDALPLAA